MADHLFPDIPASLVRAARSFHRVPGRTHHGWNHPREMAKEARKAGIALSAAEQLAILFHDAVWVPTAPAGSCEGLSAKLLLSLAAAKTDPATVSLATELILGTDHSVPYAEGQPANIPRELDLLPLASTPKRWDRWAADIRAEHPWVPDDAFVRGRIRFLESICGSSALFRHPAFSDRNPTFRELADRALHRLEEGRIA